MGAALLTTLGQPSPLVASPTLLKAQFVRFSSPAVAIPGGALLPSKSRYIFTSLRNLLVAGSGSGYALR